MAAAAAASCDSYDSDSNRSSVGHCLEEVWNSPRYDFIESPLIRSKAVALAYLAFGAVAIVADFYKWPIADFRAAFWLMVLTLLMLVGLTLYLGTKRQPEDVPISAA